MTNNDNNIGNGDDGNNHNGDVNNNDKNDNDIDCIIILSNYSEYMKVDLCKYLCTSQ